MYSSKLQKCIIELLKVEPFYAHFIMDCKIVREFDFPKDPTTGQQLAHIGVAVVRGVPTLFMDEPWFNALPDSKAKGVVKHEVMHFLFDHVNAENRKGKDPMLANIAEDVTINQYIPDLPDDGWDLTKLSKALGENLEAERESDYYYAKIMKKQHEIKDMGGGFDDHDMDVPGKDSGELAKAIARKVAKDAVNKAAGNVPKNILELVDKLGDARLPWKTLLRNSIMTQVSRKTQATTKRINRRFALPVPGKKHKREMVLGVCVDESGSVSPDQHAEFMSEIQQIAKQVTKTYLVHADCEVTEVEDLSKTKFKAKRRSAGGTAYQPAIDKCKELKCNMIVYFGDFDTADKPQNPGVPFIWVGVGNSPAPAQFGKVIRL